MNQVLRLQTLEIDEFQQGIIVTVYCPMSNNK